MLPQPICPCCKRIAPVLGQVSADSVDYRCKACTLSYRQGVRPQRDVQPLAQMTHILIATAGRFTKTMRDDLKRLISGILWWFRTMTTVSHEGDWTYGNVSVNAHVLVVRGGIGDYVAEICSRRGVPWSYVDGWDARAQRVYCLWGGRSPRVREVYTRGLEAGQMVKTLNQGRKPYQMMLPMYPV